VTLPQFTRYARRDRSRKQNLVEYGFRLPSAYDNRPLTFNEFEARVNQLIFASATPGRYEFDVSKQVVEQIIRPTGLVDPEIAVRPTRNQIDDLLAEIQDRVKANERVLVTTLTKKMAEDLTDYLVGSRSEGQILAFRKCKPLRGWRSLEDLRLGEFDVLVGINFFFRGTGLTKDFFLRSLMTS